MVGRPRVFFNFGGRGEHLPNRDGHFSLNIHKDGQFCP